MRHIDNNILKKTLQLKIFGTSIKIRSNSFTTVSLNMVKGKSAKVPGKYNFHKNSSLHFKKHCKKIDDI